MASTATLCIDRRFHGPPDSGNGGYVAGLLAAQIAAPSCRVVLKLPPPLGQPLRIARDAASASLLIGDRVVAIAAAHDFALDVPPAPALDEARQAERGYAGFQRHDYPGCFVCGPGRAAGDGLRIFAGPLGAGRVATVWRPDDSLSGDAGEVAPEFVWAALDCPGYFAVAPVVGRALLGTLEAQILRPVAIGAPIIVSGWSIASEGRKHRVGTALHDAEGGLLAFALGTWISLR